MVGINQSPKNILKKRWFWGLIVLAVFAIININSAPENREAALLPVMQGETEKNLRAPQGGKEKNTPPESLLVAPEHQQPAGEQIKETEKKTYSVIKVVDGDTISVDIGGTIEIIRLIGINTPETVDPRKPVECFGAEASNKAKELLTNKKVRLENDLTQGERDKYNRLLRYVWLEDGTFFNKEMIRDGYAYEYTYNAPYKYQAEFKQAETEAKTGKTGLWADGACSQDNQTPPTPPTPPKSQSAVDTSSIICSFNTYDCANFKTRAEAQQVFEFCGGVNSDVHKLDADKDGIACESLP